MYVFLLTRRQTEVDLGGHVVRITFAPLVPKFSKGTGGDGAENRRNRGTQDLRIQAFKEAGGQIF